MKPSILRPLGLLASLLVLVLHAGTSPASDKGTSARVETRDGQHDFDWEIGSWKTQLKRRMKPLSGSEEWTQMSGSTLVRKVWNGRANLVELDVTGPTGRIEGLSLRLYNPETQQWSLNFANIRDGALVTPTVGAFTNGRGEFYADETFDGKPIRVRFVIEVINDNTAHFEQAFSNDGGRTWEVNWIADDTRP